MKKVSLFGWIDYQLQIFFFFFLYACLFVDAFSCGCSFPSCDIPHSHIHIPSTSDKFVREIIPVMKDFIINGITVSERHLYIKKRNVYTKKVLSVKSVLNMIMACSASLKFDMNFRPLVDSKRNPFYFLGPTFLQVK